MELIRLIEPEIVVPVHTENHSLFDAKLGSDFSVITVSDGQTIDVK
ncbi:MAG TPA: hypothetical protein VGK02_07670 [Candidatus Aquicultor sp.]|jgi:mRNA degradation ribonuclease J1/J2